MLPPIVCALWICLYNIRHQVARCKYWEIRFGPRESDSLDTVYVGMRLKIRQPIKPYLKSITTVVLSIFEAGVNLNSITTALEKNFTGKSDRMQTTNVSPSHPKHFSPPSRPARATPSAPPQIPYFRSASFPCRNPASFRANL